MCSVNWLNSIKLPFWEFSEGTFSQKILKYKLDTPRLIMGHCAKFHDPRYLGTPSKAANDRITESQNQ